MTRTGRSSSVTLPSVRTARATAGGIGARAREHQDRQIGPWGLALDQIDQAAVMRQRFLGDQDGGLRRARAPSPGFEVGARDARHAVLAQHRLDQRRILADGRKDQQPALEALAGQIAHSLGFFSGTPVSTPR